MNAESMNKVYLIGTVGRSPDLRAGVSGRPIAVISLATTHATRVGTETVELVEWHRVVAYGDFATQLSAAGKGTRIAVECALRPAKWTDADGHSHRETSIVVTAILWATSPPAPNVAPVVQA